MSNTNANFEMTGILLRQEVRKLKIHREKITAQQGRSTLGVMAWRVGW